jgi:hypothetical protein
MSGAAAVDRLLIWVLLVVFPLTVASFWCTADTLKDTPVVVCTMPGGCDPYPIEEATR